MTQAARSWATVEQDCVQGDLLGGCCCNLGKRNDWNKALSVDLGGKCMGMGCILKEELIGKYGELDTGLEEKKRIEDDSLFRLIS
jgi:hypothetical protein